MENGQMSGRIDYSVPDGRNLSASLATTDYINLPPYMNTFRTFDPMWIIQGIPDRQTWLGYRAHDGNLWWTKVHAEFIHEHAAIECWFEHRGPGAGNPEDLPLNKNEVDLRRMGFMDWQGNRWYAHIGSARPGTAPQFRLERI